MKPEDNFLLGFIIIALEWFDARAFDVMGSKAARFVVSAKEKQAIRTLLACVRDCRDRI